MKQFAKLKTHGHALKNGMLNMLNQTAGTDTTANSNKVSGKRLRRRKLVFLYISLFIIIIIFYYYFIILFFF